MTHYQVVQDAKKIPNGESRVYPDWDCMTKLTLKVLGLDVKELSGGKILVSRGVCYG